MPFYHMLAQIPHKRHTHAGEENIKLRLAQTRIRGLWPDTLPPIQNGSSLDQQKRNQRTGRDDRYVLSTATHKASH